MNRKLLLSFFIVFIFGNMAIAQMDKMKQLMDDVTEETESGNLTLRFYDALNGEPISGAKVSVDSGNNLTTDFDGKVRFSSPDKDTTIPVTFEKEGYITTTLPAEVVAGTIFRNRIFISPDMDKSFFRIVLSWEKKPKDLDAHLVKHGDYHLSYRNIKVANDGKAQLDRDDQNGFGPETITIKEMDALGEYSFFVHDYSNRKKRNSRQLMQSNATVRVYGRGQLLETFNIPVAEEGTRWEVFEIKGGIIKPVNKVVYDNL